MSFYPNNNQNNATNSFGLQAPQQTDQPSQEQFQQSQPSQYNQNNKMMVELVGSHSPFGVYYTKICELLKAKDVPASRHPSRDHVLSKFLTFVDKTKLNNWLEMYIELEKTDDDNIETDIIVDTDRR